MLKSLKENKTISNIQIIQGFKGMFNSCAQIINSSEIK